MVVLVATGLVLSRFDLKASPFRLNPVAFKVLRSGCKSEAIAFKTIAIAIVLKAQRIKSERKPANLYHLLIKLMGLAIKSQAKKSVENLR